MSILVLGAIHHDVIVEAPRVPRIDETLVGTSVRYAFGGKGGNQAVAAARLARPLGLPVTMAASIGRDAQGDDALAMMQMEGVATDQVQRGDAATGMSVAMALPGGGYGAVIVSAANHLFDPDRLTLPEGLQYLVLQNELPEPINEAVSRRAKGAGVTVLLNAAPARPLSPSLTARIDMVIVNRVEAADMLGIEAESLDRSSGAARDAAVQLSKRLACRAVLTLGGEGIWLATPDPLFIRPHTVPVVSTHGAGDAFVGALVVRLGAGDDLHAAARYANAAAALHVAREPSERSDIDDAAIQALLAR